MSGIKLTVLLPILNQQIKHVIGQQDSKIVYSLFLCNTNSRCQELHDFATSLTKFCSDIIDVIYFEQLDFQEIKQEWKQRTEESK